MNCFSCGIKLEKDYIDCPNCCENLEKAYTKNLLKEYKEDLE